MSGSTAIKKGIVATYARLFVYLLISLFYPPYLLSKVGVESNGLYYLATAVASSLLLLSFGIENAYVRFATKAKEESEEKLAKTNGTFTLLFGLIGLLIVILGGVVALLFNYGAIATNSDPETAAYLVLILSASGGLDFFFSLFAWNNYFRERFVFNQVTLLVTHVLGIGLSALFLYLGYDIIAVALCTAVGVLLMDLVFFFEVTLIHPQKWAFPSLKEFKTESKEIYRFSLYIFLTVLVTSVYTNAGRLILGLAYDSGLAVTILGYALQFYSYEVLVSKAIANSFAPRLNALAVKGEDQEAGNLFLKGSIAQSTVLLFVIGGFVSAGRPFLSLWLEASLEASSLSAIYIQASSFLALFLLPLGLSLLTEVERAYGKHRFDALCSLGLALLALVAAVILVYLLPNDLKVYSVLFGFGLPLILTAAMRIIYGKKVLKMPLGAYFRLLLGPFLLMVVSAFPFTLLVHLGILDGLGSLAAFLISGFGYVFLFGLLGLLVYHKKVKAFIEKRRKKKA